MSDYAVATVTLILLAVISLMKLAIIKITHQEIKLHCLNTILVYSLQLLSFRT